MDKINKLFSELEEKSYHNLAGTLFKHAEKAKADGLTEDELLYTTYAMATQMCLDPDNKLQPFRPLFINYQNNTRTPEAGDFDDSQLTLIESTFAALESDYLKCRMADILWVCTRNHVAAVAAIEAYLNCAHQLIEEARYHDALPMLERSIRLVYHCGKMENYLTEIGKLLESSLTLPSEANIKVYFFNSKLLELLLQIESADGASLAASCHSYAEKAKGDGNWQWEQGFYELEARWYHRQRDDIKKNAALVLGASTLERRGDSCISTKVRDYMSASSWFAQAIEAYRQIPGGKDEANRIHTKLRDVQQQVSEQMSVISSPTIDLSKGIEASKNAVKGKTLFDSLMALSFLMNPPDYEKQEKTAKDMMKNFPLQTIIGKQVVSQDGRITARVPSGFSDSEEDQRLCLWDKTIEQAKYLHMLHVNGVIRPAITQICREHFTRYEDLYPVVVNNPFIPKGRELLYAKGLTYGLQLDWIEAAHLLIPQLENSLRFLLSQYGVDISSYDSKGIQDSDSVNKLLEEKKLEEILGKDFLLDLRVLLTDRFGYNLRNEMAHGLLFTGSFNATGVPYLWWLTLRLCMVPRMNERIATDAEEQEKGDSREHQAE